jgi:hypothetical protein
MVLIYPGVRRDDSCIGPRRGENYAYDVSQNSNFERPLGVLGVYGWITVRYEVFVAKTMNTEVMKWRPPGRRKRGRPKLTWAEGITGMMGEKGLMEEDWNDRNSWRKKII